jgi:hypothetical protein
MKLKEGGMKKHLIILLAVLLLCANFAFAQEQTGEIIGKVKDTEGGPLPGVAIEARCPSHIGLAAGITDEKGRYRLIGLTPGTYSISFTLPGFQTLRREGILVRLGKTYSLEVTLSQAAIEEEVTVVGESPVVDIKKSSTAVNIGKEMFDKLPRGRDFTSVVSVTTGGVNDEPLLGGTSMDGASGSENMFFVDGVDTTDMYSGTSAQRVLFEFVEEVQVKSSGYAAEYGGSMGGVINVITRSGGNKYHGEASVYFRSDELQSPPRPDLRLNPLDATQAEYITYPKDDWYQYEVGFSLGGYILKDRLWFFASFMPRYTKTSRTVNFLIDGQDHTTGQRQYSYFGQVKLTVQPFSSLRVSASFINDYYKWKGSLAQLDGTGNPDYRYDIYGYEFPGWTASARADFIASNKLFLSLDGGYFRANRKQLVEPEGPRYYFSRSNAGIPGVDPSLVRPRRWYNYSYGDGYQTKRDIKTKLTINFDGTYFFDAIGEHVVKAGVQMVRVGHDLNDAYVYDSYRLYWGMDYNSFQLGIVPTTYGYLEVMEPLGELANTHSMRWALFLQDSWTIANRLTLNFGIRMEKEDLPSYSDLPEFQEPPIKFGFKDKIAPRLGFAYDVFGDNSLKLFASFGLYYDVMKLLMAKTYGGFKRISHYYDIKTLDWTQFTETTHPDTSRPGLYEHFESVNWMIPSFDYTQPDMKPYSKLEYTAGLQKQLGENLSLTVRFLHNRILWAIEDMGILSDQGLFWYNGNPGSDWINQIHWELEDPGIPPTPKAKRNYYALNIGLDKRYSNNWMAGIHYTWSYLWGNFSGLASSDEWGRTDPNLEHSFDAWFLHYDQNLKESTGKLPTDRPHQLKVYGSYTFDFGLTVGLSSLIMSGTPVSRRMLFWGTYIYYPLGRFSDGRTPLLTRTDLYLEYNLKLRGKYGLLLNANISNLFNHKISQRTYEYYNQQSTHLGDPDILAGFDYQELCAQQGVLLDPRFLKPYAYTPPIVVRLGIKFIF